VASSYANRILWISEDDYRIIKIEFNNIENKLEKSLRFSEFKPTSDGSVSKYPVKAEMTHHVKKTSSMFVIMKGQYDIPLPDEYFSEEIFNSWNKDTDEEALSLLQQSD